MPIRNFAVLALVCAALSGCHHTRKTLVPDVPTTGDARARARFTDARAKFGDDSAEYRRIIQEYPGDPIVPWAQLYAGIADVAARKYAQADQELSGVIDSKADPNLALRAELFLGIAKNYEGDAAAALVHLRRSAKAVENDAERTEYLAGLAYATAAAGERPLAALPIFDELYGRVSATERAAIVLRVEQVAGAAPADALKRTLDELPLRTGPGVAIVASRLALLADVAGNAGEAQHLREMAAPARAAVGLPRTIDAGESAAAASAGGEGGLIGAILPLGGKSNRVAEQAVAGFGLAAGVGDGKAVAALEVRAANDADASAAAVEELARANVIAIIGPVDIASVDAAGAKAEALGVPLLSLSVQAEKNAPAGRYVFHIVHSPQSRARLLARRALAKGVKKFAILASESNYGKSVSAAFADEVARGGGAIVSTTTYKSTTKSFAGLASKLDGAWDALFVPEDAQTLGLITPALDAAGLKPRPLGAKKAPGGRPILLLSTAENLTGAYLADAGRHSEGALFAPGYYPDDQDAAGKAFLDRFIAAFGRAPGFVEAYAYDAANLAAAAGAGGRAGLAATLAKGELAGLTGTIHFDAEHHRADGGVVYTVVRGEDDTFAIRVAR